MTSGKEKPDFWTALGNRRHLLIPSPLKEVQRPLPPRLFYVSLGVPTQYSCKSNPKITGKTEYFVKALKTSHYVQLPELRTLTMIIIRHNHTL